MLRLLVLLVVGLSLSACANIYKAKNSGITKYQSDGSYRLSEHAKQRPLGENLVILAFSGGGTRAAALSYGVLQELRDTVYQDGAGGKSRLLDEVDFISSVSGGSFTSAYYAAFGDQIFTDFEDDFLRQSVEGALLSRFLSPRHWFRSLWSGFDRTEMAIEYYDRHVFKGKKFKDIDLSSSPLVLINATDLSKGSRFVFDQDSFDWICADLSDISLARAVTASSAVPIAFPSVVLKNRGGQCDLSESDAVRQFKALTPETVRQKSYIESVSSYQQSSKRPYIHLVDGGISDNLGLRAVSDQLQIYGVDKKKSFERKVKRVIVILVNSTVKPSRDIDQSANTPAFGTTIDAVTSALMEHYDTETRAYFFDQASEFKMSLSETDPDINFYLAEVSFQDLPESRTRSLFNNLPTSLELTDAQIDAVIAAGRKLLREQKAFVDLKRDLLAEVAVRGEGANYLLDRKIKAIPSLVE